MDKNDNIEKNEEKINLDKFTAHRGEFVPVTAELLKGKKFTAYAEFIEDDEDKDEIEEN
jgi:hypothetical protein